MLTPLAYFDLVETLPKPGCAICNLLLRDVDHFLDLLLYERVNEPYSHRSVRTSRGLCSEHGRQLITHKGGATGIAVLYQAAVDEVLKIMAQTPVQATTPSGFARFLNGNGDAGGVALADQLEPTEPCMACKLLIDSEDRYTHIFSENMGDDRLLDAYRASDGLCLPHFRQVLRRINNPNHLQPAIAIQTAIWERLKADLKEFIDKNDHRRMHEKMGAEGDSWQRAIRRMAGEKGVFGVETRSTT